jgi:hypothetical protein
MQMKGNDWMSRFRTAVGRWWSRSVVSHWRKLPKNARLATVAGVFLSVVLVAAAGFAVASGAAGQAPGQTGSASALVSPSSLADASMTPTSPPKANSEQPSVASSPATPAPTALPSQATLTLPPLAPTTAPTLATLACKPYPSDEDLYGEPADPVVSGGLLYIYCNPTGDKSPESVVAIDLSTNQIVRTYDFEFPFEEICLPMRCSHDIGLDLAVDHGLWVGGEVGTVRLDLTTGRPTLTQGRWLFVGHTPGRIWVDIPANDDSGGGVIQAIDPSTGKATSDPAFHYLNTETTVHVCSAMVVADLLDYYTYATDLSLLTPPTDSPAWPIHLNDNSGDQLGGIGQADGGCWTSMIREDDQHNETGVYLLRLGADNGIESRTDIIQPDPQTSDLSVRFYDGQAWLVRETAKGTYVQRLALPSLTLVDKPMRVPVTWQAIAGGSIWARNTQGYLVRLGLNGATPAPSTPSPKPTITTPATPTPTAGPSS